MRYKLQLFGIECEYEQHRDSGGARRVLDVCIQMQYARESVVQRFASRITMKAGGHSTDHVLGNNDKSSHAMKCLLLRLLLQNMATKALYKGTFRWNDKYG